MIYQKNCISVFMEVYIFQVKVKVFLMGVAITISLRYFPTTVKYICSLLGE